MVCVEWVGVICSGNDLPREGDSWKSGISGNELYAVCLIICLFYAHIFPGCAPISHWLVFMFETSLKLHALSIGCMMKLKIGSNLINPDCMSLLSYPIGVGRHAIF